MSGNIFGTDGLRGEFGSEFINAIQFTKLGYAMNSYLKEYAGVVDNPTVVIGRDTRASGEELTNAFISGLNIASDYNVLNTGIMPTPAVAMAVCSNHADFGAVITASHNPAADNGIKFFSKQGIKLDLEAERQITRIFNKQLPVDLSKQQILENAPIEQRSFKEAYLKSLETLFPKGELKGWKIVLDMANGAACETAPAAFERLGAELVRLGNQPNGSNINEACGSEHPKALCEKVVAEGACLGISFDGDGDRLVLCDEKGSLLDGDEVLALLALHAQDRGVLSERGVVVTVMSNLGLDEALRNVGVPVERVAVGDRNVVQKMMEKGCQLGGESSGHIIFLDHFPTGDGLYASLKVIEIVKETGFPLSQLRHCIKLHANLSRNIEVAQNIPFDEIPSFTQEVRALEAEMAGEGRLLIRYSGTEPLLRVLVEGPNQRRLEIWMKQLESAIYRYLPVK